jgi:hypothetical protein
MAKICIYCEEEIKQDYESSNNIGLCEECDNAYENKTGYCSLECCISGYCDQTC